MSNNQSELLTRAAGQLLVGKDYRFCGLCGRNLVTTGKVTHPTSRSEDGSRSHAGAVVAYPDAIGTAVDQARVLVASGRRNPSGRSRKQATIDFE